MAYGFGTWDANGFDNNKGIVPTSILSYASLASGNLTGNWSFSVPSGRTLRFLFFLNGNEDGGGNRRSIVVSGASVIMSAASSGATGTNIFPPSAAYIIFYVV